MKRLTLSTGLALIAVIAASAVPTVAQAASGQQRSSASSIHELVQYNRDVRDKN
ncbi:hypothetical protein [cf. Phormidesmis sp. LEGE 11477]|uniref:hypothetical protein n=1 Tax=cf. Phormidesmis sp. LEGE 11477 TaxID=1828680 RepID=UPI00187ED283|nr:hypothetical protein [cf. Phormidesmis sp. LEGE 11477]MBE9062520.1 hypothetical protein [cf. Phormidesmis sp. LEGE 11477]